MDPNGGAPTVAPPAEAVALARRELARRPAPTLADVRLAPPDRALVSFTERYPAVAERFHGGVLWAARPDIPLAELLALAPPDLAGQPRADLAAAGLDPAAAGWPPL